MTSAAHIKASYLLALARKLSDALRNDVHIQLAHESNEAREIRRSKVEEQSARVMDMLASEFERVDMLNTQLGYLYEPVKRTTSSFQTKRNSGNGPSRA